MKEKYESLSLAILRDLAKARGMKGISAMKKSRLIEAMLEQDEKDRETEAGEQRMNDAEDGADMEAFDKKAETDGAGNAGQRRYTREVTEKASQDAEAGRYGKASQDADAERYNKASQDADAERYNKASQDADTERYSRASQDADAGHYSKASQDDSAERRSRVFQSENTERRGTDRARGSRGERPSQSRPPRDNKIPLQRPPFTIDARAENSFAEKQRARLDSVLPQGRTVLPQPVAYSAQNRAQSDGQASNRAATEYTAGNRAPEQSVPNRSAGEYTTGNRTPEHSAPNRSTAEYAAGNRTPEYSGPNRPTGEYSTPGRVPEPRQDTDKPPAELSQLDSGQTVSGILEVMPDGYGFIRSDNYLPGENDVYVSPSQIRRFNLKTGDIISGNTRIKSQQEKFSALLYLKRINDLAPSEAMRRYNFEDMTPVFPNERLRMERGTRAIAMRIVDLFSPIGKGQRGMIVSPPKAGKTTLLKDIARSILENDPNMRLLILLIDERPEEVTDIREAICGENVEVIYSTFDELPEHHKRVSEMVIERAKRLVEQKQDVTILLDSITRLARAYNLTVPPSGRTLSGGLDPAALHMPKRFFGAARNMREGGSLTILATALVDTGSKMDDVVYEEFKGTGNMELVLDRKLSEKRVFPAIDIPKSGTRREDLLLDRDEQEAIYIMRRALNGMKSDEAVENILNMFVHTRDNSELVQRIRRQKFV